VDSGDWRTWTMSTWSKFRDYYFRRFLPIFADFKKLFWWFLQFFANKLEIVIKNLCALKPMCIKTYMH
jgi:hypothetical protein